ncbi:enoyl CoA hydratase domain-containing protein 1 [Desmophyllum pertusum]|uniref:Ethylmalonyl-CoA decarboxylase n=1 Tax=Desmophyllum pertusum TaxID=174260 RepID=A0A9W9ZAJ0_9CNID|nr:enoyl CoA hydratase domain-containing protein 1 [Desmophyllum pertusum]
MRSHLTHPARSKLTRFTVRTFSRLFYSSTSKIAESSYDEAEVRKKFKVLGSGDVTLTKLAGNQKGMAVISLLNPERKNALTGYMMVKLAEVIDELEQWEHGKALVLHGCEGSFCSGADLSVVKAINTPEEGNLMCAFMQRTLTRLGRLPLVSVAAIEGRALGGGAELATACDFRLMSRNAEIRFVQVKMGLTPGWGGGARLVRLLGKQKALQLLGKGEKVDLCYGRQLGLIDDELPHDQDVVTSCCDWLSEFLAADTTVLRAVKGVVTAGDDSRLKDELDIERSIFTTLWGAEANKKALEKSKKHR